MTTRRSRTLRVEDDRGKMASRGELVTQIRDLCSQPSGSDFDNMIKAQLNRTYRHVLTKAKLDEQRRVFEVTTVADTYRYGMPLYVKEVLSIIDTTNDRMLYDMAQREFDRDYPNSDTSGTPVQAIPFGTFGVQKQPAAAGALTLVSDVSTDGGSTHTVQVVGYVSNNLVTESVQMSGTTEVTTTNSYDATDGIEKITKTPTTTNGFTGNITVTDSSDNTLSVIPVWWDSPTYMWWEFHPRPSSAITYNVRAIMRKPDLIQDGDYPDIDNDFHDVLVHGSVAILAPHVGMTDAGSIHASIFRTRMEEFMDAQSPRSSRVRTFEDVTSRANSSNLPRRPYDPGRYM